MIRKLGFTLLELVVGMSVLAGVISTAYLCLHAGLAAQDVIEARRDACQSARFVFSIMARDLAASCRLSEEFEFEGMDRKLGDLEADNLDFGTLTWAPRGPGEGDFCEVSYYVDRSPKTGEIGLWRRCDPTLDPEPLDGGTKEELASGIAAFRLEYYDGYTWYDSWGKSKAAAREEASILDRYANRYGVPDAVRITLALRQGRPRPPGEPEEPPMAFQTVVHLNLARKLMAASTELPGGEASTSAAGDEVGAETEGEL